jgi:UDP-N-acetylglucosamine 1-carboxyvinyltransferase
MPACGISRGASASRRILPVEKFRIEGPSRLAGKVRISGAKNAALPAFAAALLTPEPVRLTNVPRVVDLRTMGKLLEHIGATVEVEGDAVTIEAREVRSPEAPYDLVKTMRASVLVLGPLLARAGCAKGSLPGGCAIGVRPINYHIAAFRKLGAEVSLEHGDVEAKAARLRGAPILFDQVSVTGTENAMLAAVLAEGTTRLENAAREPEVRNLAELLNKMGARITGAGESEVVIEGVPRLSGAAYAIIPDRIEAGTYAIAAGATGGDVCLEGADASALQALVARLSEMGVRFEEEPGGIRVRGGGELAPCDIATAPHPGFPTDLQAQVLALATRARGVSTITENIFENRFQHVPELARMGARVRLDGRRAHVEGPTPLTGASVMATDLRASASLVIAGLMAEGATVVDRIYHLDRGYDRMEEKLNALGAKIERSR